MAKFKGKGVVVAGLIAGVTSYLSKKENRDKAMEYFSKAKDKVNETGMQSLMQKAQEKMLNGQANGEFPKDLDTNISKSASVGKEAYEEESLEDIASTAGNISDHTLEGNQMIEEGGSQTTLDYFNHEQENQL
jgi:YesN/AraC family two-component response regulator